LHYALLSIKIKLDQPMSRAAIFSVNLAVWFAFAVVLHPPTFAQSASHGTSLSIEGAFARATIGSGKTGATYLTIRNPTDHPDRLIGARITIAEKASLHTHLHQDGVMKMRPLKAVEIPAKGMVVFKPGAAHLMLMGLKVPLRMGESFPLVLVFEKAGEIIVSIPVLAVGAKSAGHGAHKN
jgi:copper(I)-binding protein